MMLLVGAILGFMIGVVVGVAAMYARPPVVLGPPRVEPSRPPAPEPGPPVMMVPVMVADPSSGEPTAHLLPAVEGYRQVPRELRLVVPPSTRTAHRTR